ISYNDAGLPELYNNIEVIVEEPSKNGTYTVISNKYKLQATGAQLRGNKLEFNRETIHHNNGIINFILTHKGNNIPLELTLPVLKEIRFNLYADSIKPVLNYYLNVEGVFSNGKIYPLDTSFINIT